MFVLAITGGVACGKSNVCTRLIERPSVKNTKYFSCDESVGELLTESETLERLAEVAGNQVIDDDGGLNRQWLRDTMFNDASLRKRVEAVLHPKVLESARAFIRSMKGESPLVIIEVPLLYEVDFPIKADRILVVGASKRTQMQRLTEKRHLNRKTALEIIEVQKPIEEKINRCDWVIWNDGCLDSLEIQIDLTASQLERKFK